MEAVIATPAIIDNAFVEQVRHDMLAFAQLQLRDATLAEDAVQEALTAALTGGRDFAGRSALKTWVFGILRHKIVDLIRQQSRTTPISAFGGDDDSLDQAFDTLFKENAHWHPAHRPATTTISPIMHIKSCTSSEFSLRPWAFLKVSTVKRNSFLRGSGPDARPPNTLRRAPAGRTLLKSTWGMSPFHRCPSSA